MQRASSGFFIAANSEYYKYHETACSCINPNNSEWIPKVQKIFGNNCFCDKAAIKSFSAEFYSDDPLWDGASCEEANTCYTLNNPPWFYREFPGTTSEDMKVKINLDKPAANEDVAIEKIDIYVH